MSTICRDTARADGGGHVHDCQMKPNHQGYPHHCTTCDGWWVPDEGYGVPVVFLTSAEDRLW